MKNLFNNKKIKYATFSSIVTILLVVVLVVANLVFETTNITFDMTKDKANSLSAQTETFLSDLDEDIIIYPLYKTGEVYKPFEEIFSRYESSSSHIKVQYVDPYQNPQFVEQYKTDGEEIPTGSVIVQGKDKFKVVDSSGLIEVGNSVTVYNLEPRLTNAIVYVTSDNAKKVYIVSGHNELEMSETIKSAIKSANFDIEYISLFEQIPEDCDALILSTPQSDYTLEESQKVIEYLTKGGSAFITTDILINKPNYNTIIESFGLTKGEFLIMEGENSKYVENVPINIIPTIEETELTKNLIEKKRVLLTPTVTAIIENKNVKASTKITPLLTTSFKSYGKVDPNAKTFSFENGDVNGPFTISVLLEDTHSLSDENVTKMVVVSTSAIIDDSINSYIGGGNQDFIISSLKYFSGDSEEVYLSPKVVTTNTLSMNFGNVVFILIYSVILLPISILVIGFVVILRRKNR